MQNEEKNPAQRSLKERFPELVIAFRKAIYDQIKEQHPDGYRPSTANLRAAAFPAIKEVMESEAEQPFPPMAAVVLWNAVMLSNESAFHQGMEREIKAKTLDIKVIKGAAAVAASDYL